jgi:hypothetical protein
MINQTHFWTMVIMMGVASYIITNNNIMLTFRNGIYDHIGKFYMALLMAIIMAIISVILMFEDGHHMYNPWYLLLILLVLTIILTQFIRNQTLINDEQFIKGMIEHHDMALLMSEKIMEKTNKRNIYEFAKRIIQTQQNEIDYMKYLLNTNDNITYDDYKYLLGNQLHS